MFLLTNEMFLVLLRACTTITDTSKVTRQRDQTHQGPFAYYVITRVSVCVGKSMNHDCVICERSLKPNRYTLPESHYQITYICGHHNCLENTMA